ncbi:MAG TPA: hypothetical protein VG754_07520, partial [Verrucomicrobiae bacterium]|nr:hypothetical protein [Verrucomicrobiae bacterium]
ILPPAGGVMSLYAISQFEPIVRFYQKGECAGTQGKKCRARLLEETWHITRPMNHSDQLHAIVQRFIKYQIVSDRKPTQSPAQIRTVIAEFRMLGKQLASFKNA